LLQLCDTRNSERGGELMFDVSLNWINGLGQVIAYAVIIAGVLWVLSKIEIKEKEGKGK
jgi:hypothetical protein